MDHLTAENWAENNEDSGVTPSLTLCGKLGFILPHFFRSLHSHYWNLWGETQESKQAELIAPTL